MKLRKNLSIMSQRKRHTCSCHVFTVEHGTFYSLLFTVFLLNIFNHCVNDIAAFNLENRLPIVKYGDADTYFGYSIAGHEIDGQDNKPNEKW